MSSRRPHPHATLLLLAALPLPARDQPGTVDERFGVMTHFAHGWDAATIPMVARSGVAGVRDELYWREIEPEKGRYTFPAAYETTMAALAKHGLSPFVVLSFENDHYDGGATPHSDEALRAYARYGVEVVTHYGKQIRAVEIWNEYNGGFVRGPAQSDRAGNYLRMLRATYPELKRARPDLTIVGGATAGVPLPYWEKLFAGGGLAYMDALSVHPYRFDAPPEGIETDIAELAALVARHNGGQPKPIWVSEIGWQTRPSAGPGDLAIDDLVQAQFLVRAYALLLSANVQRIHWYLYRDYQEFKMGLAREDGTTMKPAFAAMTTLTRQLRGARFIARDRTPPEIYSIRFRRPGGDDVRVMWSLQPRQLPVSGVAGVTDLLGRTVSAGGRLDLGESPVFVTGSLKGLPEPTSTVIADARQGFSGTQGQHGWSYGYLGPDGSFVRLPTFTADDWHTLWKGEPPFLALTSTDQHPSAVNGSPVAAVRRWQSDRSGPVRVTGGFRGGKSGGDGLGVAIAVNGERRFRKLLGGGAGSAVGETFDFVVTVQPGATIDFIVDPGPAASIDHDNTNVAVTISTSP